METTLNNIFKRALNNAVEDKILKEIEEEKRKAIFIEDMNLIKKNLESAFIGTPIRVEMGMYGVQELCYMTIRIVLPKGWITGITSNSALYHGVDWVETIAGEKDLRVNGKPMTYDELINKVAVKYAESC